MSVELLTKTEAAQPGGGAGDGGDDEVVGSEGVGREHPVEDREHEGGGFGVGDGGEEGGVEVEVPARGFVEQLVGVREEAGLGVGSDEEGRGGRVVGQALLEEARVGAADGRRRARRGAECGGGGREHA